LVLQKTLEARFSKKHTVLQKKNCLLVIFLKKGVTEGLGTTDRALRQGEADVAASGAEAETSALSPEQVLSMIGLQSRDCYLNEALRDGVTPGDLADVTKEELYRENEVLCTRPPHTCFHAQRLDAGSE
jgi:hypothetical protein